jgi:hypothetical protein
MTPQAALATLKSYIDAAPMPSGSNPPQIAQILNQLNEAFKVLNDAITPEAPKE